MRFAYVLFPLTLLLLAMTSGCHHRHFCCGGCAAPCCSPCGSCCGYAPSIEGPMPPLVAPQGSIVAPQMPSVGMR